MYSDSWFLLSDPLTAHKNQISHLLLTNPKPPLQDFVLPDVRDRQFLLCFHKRAKKLGLNVDKYNMLKNRLAELHKDLERLRDPLALNLPHAILKEPRSTQAPLAKAQQTLKNLLRLREDK